jgi:hypothetical protein
MINLGGRISLSEATILLLLIFVASIGVLAAAESAGDEETYVDDPDATSEAQRRANAHLAKLKEVESLRSCLRTDPGREMARELNVVLGQDPVALPDEAVQIGQLSARIYLDGVQTYLYFEQTSESVYLVKAGGFAGGVVAAYGPLAQGEALIEYCRGLKSEADLAELVRAVEFAQLKSGLKRCRLSFMAALQQIQTGSDPREVLDRLIQRQQVRVARYEAEVAEGEASMKNLTEASAIEECLKSIVITTPIVEQDRYKDTRSPDNGGTPGTTPR